MITEMDERFDALTAWLEERMARMDVPGAALGVFQGGEVRSTGLGVADVRTNEPVDSDTVFQLASLTKIFTASGIVHIGSNAGLDLSAPIACWYPPFAVSDPTVTEKATMAHLLSHSAGWADLLEPGSDSATDALDHYVEQMASFPQIAQPGRLFNYSNSSYLLAGHILATITDEPYETAVKNLVLSPLGLAHIGFEREDLAGLVVASGHAPSQDGMKTLDAWEVPKAAWPAAGLHGTVDDLLRFVQYHAGAFAPQAIPLLEADRLRMQSLHGPGGSVGVMAVDGFGLGWMRVDIGGRQVLMSMGSDAGQAAAMAFVPDGTFGIVVLANAESGLFLANDTLAEAFALFLDARRSELVPIALESDELAATEGSFAIPNDLTFAVTSGESGLEIATSAGGQPVPDLSGPLTMIEIGRGYIDRGGSPLLYDFVRADSGDVDWVRFAGRLAPRMTT